MFHPSLKIRHWPQWWTGLILSLLGILYGFTIGSTSPYMARLTAADGDLPLSLTEAEASWVASLLNLGRLFGALFGAVLQEFIGFKKNILFSAIPMGMGWICVIFANSAEWLYVSRLLCGIAVGVFKCSTFPFIAEIADPMIRGSLLFLYMDFAVLGALLGGVMGTFLTMNEFSYVNLSVTILFAVLFISVPESPYYYIAAKDLPKATKALLWYKRDADVTKELEEMQDLVGTTKMSFATIWQEIKKPEHQKSMMIIFVLNGFLYCSGHEIMAFYAEVILTKSKIEQKPSIVVIVLGLIAIVPVLMSTLVIDKFTKRSLLYASAAGVAVAQAILGLHFHLLSLSVKTSSITWLPILGFLLFSFSIVIGFMPIPSVLSGELFPPILKTMGALNNNVGSSLIAFAVLKSFQPFLDLVGEKFVFWTFAGVALLSIVFTYFFVPETKGKSLAEIQEDLKKSKEELAA